MEGCWAASKTDVESWVDLMAICCIRVSEISWGKEEKSGVEINVREKLG